MMGDKTPRGAVDLPPCLPSSLKQGISPAVQPEAVSSRNLLFIAMRIHQVALVTVGLFEGLWLHNWCWLGYWTLSILRSEYWQ